MVGEPRLLLRSASVCCFAAFNATITLAMVIAPPGSPAAHFADWYRMINLATAIAVLVVAIWRKWLGWLSLVGLVQLVMFIFVAAPIINHLPR